MVEEEPSALEDFVTDNATSVGLVALAIAIVFGIAWTWAAAHRHERLKAMAPTAAKHGLDYSPADRFGSTQIAFPLFRAGDGRRVEHVMWRDGANGLPVRVFEYSYYDEHRDNDGKLIQRWQHFTCAMARHNGLWPMIRIGRERALHKVAQRLGLPDIELESEEFNRAFVIQCADRRFATDLLDPQMMELLLTSQALVDFETKGRWLLLTTKRLHPRDMPGLLGLADEFVQRIPPLIWELYPKAPDDADRIPEEGLGFATGAGVVAGDGIFIPGQDLFAEEDDTRSTPKVEYDLDGNPVRNADENPWG
jgi:hypothetical protein